MLMKLIILININIIIASIFMMIYHYIKNVVRKRDIFDRYSETIYIFEKAKEFAYQKMFRDHILVYSSSGYRIDKENLDTFQSIYVKYVYRTCGRHIMDDLKIIHGDLDSICLQLVSEFIQKIEQDESAIIGKVTEKEKEKIEDATKV